jgi:hypothetical protein
MRNKKSMSAVLFALTAAGAAMGQQQASPAAREAPPRAGASEPYSPTLQPRDPTPPPAAAENTPQAQEERSGVPPQPIQDEVDPSARPAPQPPRNEADGAARSAPRDKKQQARPPRRSTPQTIATMPRQAPPSNQPYAAVPTPAPSAAPVPVAPAPVPINTCNGGNCTDAAGATYNTGVGNTAISNDGRLCNRVGTTVQCL